MDKIVNTRVLLAWFLAFCIGACSAPRQEKLMIATAANVQFAMDELVAAFQKESGIDCAVILGSSGKLTAQIQQGAPYHVFISADMKYPQALYEQGLTKDSAKVYAYGKLVLWSLKEEFDLIWEELSQKSIQKIALANPQTAPYGRAAQEALHYYKQYESVADKLVYGESVAQTNQFILSQAADVGFTAMSVVLSASMQNQGYWLEVPKESYAPIAQGVALIQQEEKNIQAAEQFYTFLFSEQAEKILAKYGYVSPQVYE